MEPAVPYMILFFSTNHMGLGDAPQGWQYEELCGSFPSDTNITGENYLKNPNHLKSLAIVLYAYMKWRKSYSGKSTQSQ